MKKIFIAEDSATVRQHTQAELEKLGYTVVVARDGREAKDKLPQMDVDLLITDYHMPYLNGIELVKSVRQMMNKRFIPVLMFTTEKNEAQIRAGRAIGVSAWLNKTTDMKRLPTLVRMLVGN